MAEGSDCKYAGEIHKVTGLRWCDKFQQYMRKDQEDNCEGYEKK